MRGGNRKAPALCRKDRVEVSTPEAIAIACSGTEHLKEEGEGRGLSKLCRIDEGPIDAATRYRQRRGENRRRRSTDQREKPERARGGHRTETSINVPSTVRSQQLDSVADRMNRAAGLRSIPRFSLPARSVAIRRPPGWVPAIAPIARASNQTRP